MTPRVRRVSFGSILLVLFAVLFLLIVAATLLTCQGHLIYSLDDPYIHLALAQKLGQLHYGINSAEYSAPCSSILYPFLLAAGLKLGLGGYAPAVINAMAGAGTVVSIAVLAAKLRLPAEQLPLPAIVMVAATIVLCSNAVGLAMTGMEHSLHVLVTGGVVLGLLQALQAGIAPWWLLACLAAQPLIRFEGVAVTGAAILVLLLARHGRMAAAAALAVGAEMTLYAAFMHHLGLPAMPSSVLAKSSVVREAGSGSLTGLIKGAVANGLHNEMGRPALLLTALLACLVGWLAMRPERLRQLRVPGDDTAQAGMALFAVIVLAAHLAAGQCGWFERYEAYALFVGVAAVAAVWPALKLPSSPRRAPVVRTAIFCGLTCLILLPYARATLLTPLAASDIYRQQYQMHRFATEFHHGPVGVNDIGMVSFGNKDYVLDFWGLASEQARLARQRGAGVAWMDAMTRSYGVDVVMIYDKLFPVHPSGWIKLGTLDLHAQNIIVASPQVAFYATGVAPVAPLVKAFAAFSATLPPGASATAVQQ
jgi:hypothetical protein